MRRCSLAPQKWEFSQMDDPTSWCIKSDYVPARKFEFVKKFDSMDEAINYMKDLDRKLKVKKK